MGLLDEIRAASAAVMQRAQFVRIRAEMLAALADSLASEAGLGSETTGLDPAHQQLATAGATLAFVVTLDAINFGSGWFPELEKRAGCSGYFTLAGSLKDHFDRHGPLQARELTLLTPGDCSRIFGQETASPAIAELMSLFARALADLGRFLEARFGGSFAGLVEEARGSCERLVELLAEMTLYQDVARYDDLVVPFYKRAQITCADLGLAFGGRGWGAFHDLDRLTLFADNLVPHVLRCEGVLEYEPALLARIEREELIAPGSAEEVEIRAAALHAVERISLHLAAQDRATPAWRLDQLLWTRGQSPAVKAHPRHRTRCSFY